MGQLTAPPIINVLNPSEEQYLSISDSVDYEITVQRSRFIASLRRALDHSEFESNIKQISKHYTKATHYCWAYRFSASTVIEHSSDSGEPAGTAGRPILGALKKHSVLNIMAVVTRYYGGIKLGIKGLIDAYGSVTNLALENSNIIIVEPTSLMTFTCSYESYNIFLSIIEKSGIKSRSIKPKFSDNISGEIEIPNSLLLKLSDELDGLSIHNFSFNYQVTNSKKSEKPKTH
jgi:uncharacterized YigZ family protein